MNGPLHSQLSCKTDAIWWWRICTAARRGRSNADGGEAEGSKEGEMLTFSREQRCIEAAVAVASPPPSPLCISLSLPPSLPFLFSSVQTDRDEKLAVDQNTPPSITACYPPRMLPPPFLSLALSLFLSLFLSPPLFFPPVPLILLLRFPAVPAPSVSHSAHLSSPASSLFHFQSSSLHPSSSLPPSFSLISSLLLSPPLFTSTPTSKQQK